MGAQRLLQCRPALVGHQRHPVAGVRAVIAEQPAPALVESDRATDELHVPDTCTRIRRHQIEIPARTRKAAQRYIALAAHARQFGLQGAGFGEITARVGPAAHGRTQRRPRTSCMS
jgi:hypothetical protein